MKAKAIIQTTIELALAAIGLALAFHQIYFSTLDLNLGSAGLSPDPLVSSALLLEIVCYYIASFILFYILMSSTKKLADLTVQILLKGRGEE